MGDTWTMGIAAETSVTSTFLLVVLGAVVGVVPALTVERFRSKDARDSRARDLTLDRTTEFTRAARRLRARSEAYGSNPTDANLGLIVTAHEDLWVAFESLVMVAGVEIQETAREVLHHAYSVREQYEEGSDPRADTYPDTSPRGRLIASLRPYYTAVRRELGVPEPDRLYAER